MIVDLNEIPFGYSINHGMLYRLYGIVYSSNFIHLTQGVIPFNYSNTLNVVDMALDHSIVYKPLMLPNNIPILDIDGTYKDLIKKEYSYSGVMSEQKYNVCSFRNLVRKKEYKDFKDFKDLLTLTQN